MRIILFIFALLISVSGYSQSAAFFMSTVKEAVVEQAPVNTVAPAITGLEEVGETLSVTTGSWDNSPTSYSYQWKRDGSNISSANSNMYLLIEDDEGAIITCEVTATNSAGSTPQLSNATGEIQPSNPEPSPSSITSNHVFNIGTGDKALVYQPPGYDDNEDLYPLIIFYHGNGERGIPSSGTYSVGTGNGSTDSWSGTMNNTQRIIHSEFSVEVNSTEVATGHLGVITGSGVTGTYDQDDNSASAYSITFDTPPASGHSVVFKYTQANALSMGPMRFLNQGDEPNVLYVAPQIQRAQEVGSFTPETDWDDLLDYLDAEGYRFDINRIYITGLSLGGDQIIKLFTDRNPGSGYTWAAFVCAAPGSDTGVPSSSPGTAYANATNKGKLVVRGTSDGNGTFTGMMANSNGSDREFPVQMLQYWNIGHSTALWDTKVYNRKNRTDGGGSADFDYIEDFMLQFSLDDEQQAELWVERAEATNDSGDYRVALRQVSNLSNGSFKTALQGRLATVLSAIGRIVVVDIGHASFTSASPFNNLTSNASSASVASLIDQSASNTGWTFTCVTAPDGSPTTVNNIGSSNRVSGRQFGFQHNTTRDGHRIASGGTVGTYRFSGLDNGKQYTIKVYSAMGQSSWSNRAEVTVVCNSTSRDRFDDPVNFQASDTAPSGAYSVFRNVTPSSGNIDFTINTRQTASTERESYIQVAEIIEQP